jgi:hypothetical protein
VAETKTEQHYSKEWKCRRRREGVREGRNNRR